MNTYFFTVDSQFLISGTDASGAFSNESYPTISGFIGDNFSFTFFQDETYAFSIEETDFQNKYDTSFDLNGTTEVWTPTTTGVYQYANPIDFESFGNIIIEQSPQTTTTTTTTTTTPEPTTTTTEPTIDTCNCGSFEFSIGGKLIINNIAYPLLHDQIGNVGQGQKFTTAIDRIPTNGIYPNSIKIDFSQYPVYISHSVRFVLMTNDNEIIASKYVGVNNKLLKLQTPIEFKNINQGIDLYNKVILLNVESVCDYEDILPCCDKMPSSFSIENSITTLELICFQTPAITTTTTTVEAPSSPLYSEIPSPNTSIEMYQQTYILNEPTIKNSYNISSDIFQSESFNLFNNLYNLPIQSIFVPNYNIGTAIISSKPLFGDMCSWSYFTQADFELEIYDKNLLTYIPKIFLKSLETRGFPNLHYSSYDSKSDIITYDNSHSCEDFFQRYFIGRFTLNSINSFINQDLSHYVSKIELPLDNDNCYHKLFGFVNGFLREVTIKEIITSYTVNYRTRIISNSKSSAWNEQSMNINISTYRIIDKT